MTDFPTTAHLDNPRTAQLPGASQYEINEHGFVSRRGRRLRLQNRSGRWFAQVYTDEGVRWSFDTEKVARSLFGEEEVSLTREDVEDVFGARRIPDYPRYAVTSYGAIYCVDPPKRGPNAGQVYLLQEILRNDIPYVTLTDADGVRAPIRVSDVVGYVWD